MTTKAERRAAAQAVINEKFADVEPAHRPSPWQFQMWDKFVEWSDKCDDDGYWEGRCPLSVHDHPARFNFLKDVMQCNREDFDGKPSCHEGKNMLSLGNAMSMRSHG